MCKICTNEALIDWTPAYVVCLTGSIKLFVFYYNTTYVYDALHYILGCFYEEGDSVIFK